MKLGLFTVLFDGRPLAEVADRAAELGYRAIELAVGSQHYDREAAATDPAYLAGLGRVVAERELEISALSDHISAHMILPPNDGSIDGWAATSDRDEMWKAGRARLLATARQASELEVSVVCGFLGGTVWESWYTWPPERLAVYERGWELLAERWSPILADFARLGVRFAHEVHPGQIAYNLDTAARAFELLGRDDLGLNFDPSHLVWQGIDPVVFVHTFGDRILHVHAKDVEVRPELVRRDGVLSTGSWQRPGRAVRPRVPGWGDVEWRRVITALLEVGYDGVLSFEHEDPVISEWEGAIQAARYLEPLLLHDRLGPGSGAHWLV